MCLLQCARRAFSRCLQSAGFFFRLLPLVVMPLDGVEHASAKHKHFERDKDYREPIHLWWLSWLLMGAHHSPVQRLKTLRQQLHRVQAIVDLHIDSTGPMI